MEIKVKHVGDEKFQVLLQGERYRVSNITKVCKVNDDGLSVKNMPLKYGLNVEQKLDNGSYYVVITVYYDPEEELSVRYDNCGYRLIDTLRDAYKGVDPVKGMEYVEEFANCLEFARDTVIDLNKAD